MKEANEKKNKRKRTKKKLQNFRQLTHVKRWFCNNYIYSTYILPNIINGRQQFAECLILFIFSLFTKPGKSELFL